MRTPAIPGPTVCRGLPRELELRVAVNELIALDDGRQVALVRDVEEDREAARDEDNRVELPDRQGVEGVGDRDRHQTEGAGEVARSGSGGAAADRPRRRPGG